MKKPDYIEPMLLAARPYTTTGTRDAAATIAWEVAKALEAAGYRIEKARGDIDHEQLLIKFIDYIETEDYGMGVGYHWETSSRAEHRQDPVNTMLTDEEWAELRRLGGYSEVAEPPADANAE